MHKRVLLTGGAGSIGIHVIGHIMHNTDWEIVNIDSFTHKGYHARLEQTFKDHPDWESRVKTIQHNLVCPISDLMAQRIGKIDYILHLAAMSDVFFSVENPVFTIRNNIESTLTVLEYARQIKPEIFIYFSTDETLGPVKKGDAHDEKPLHRPSNAYSASKAACEDICYAYWRSYDLPIVITRTMNNFGEFQSRSKFPIIVQNKVAKGETVIIHGNEKEIGSRFYIHSRNVADALLHIIKIGARKHQIGELDEPHFYHIVGEKNYNNLELAQLIAKLMNKPLKYKLQDFHKDNPAHDIHYGLQDNNLKATGWKPPVPIEESLKNTIQWQMEHKEWIE